MPIKTILIQLFLLSLISCQTDVDESNNKFQREKELKRYLTEVKSYSKDSLNERLIFFIKTSSCNKCINFSSLERIDSIIDETDKKCDILAGDLNSIINDSLRNIGNATVTIDAENIMKYGLFLYNDYVFSYKNGNMDYWEKLDVDSITAKQIIDNIKSLETE